MAKHLIIVESPAKVKTIKKFLGSNFLVQASVGHVRDLPHNSLGVDEANGFAPYYEIIDKKQNIVNELRQAAGKVDVVYLAPDPDREGEAIAWHIAELIRDKASTIKRIQFNEITEHAVREALQHPRDLDANLFDAQQARRILDRLVGYKISPLLWKTVRRGISAGRVQSVALRLIVEREMEREAFTPEEYWPFHAILSSTAPPPFKAELIKIAGKKAHITNSQEAADFEKSIQGLPFIVDDIQQKERSKTPPPPFITSTLQQAANQRFGYPTKRTMQIAQRLYEGIDLPDRGLTALITYMRTDSTRIAKEAATAAKDFINLSFGPIYLPPKARVYKAKGSAQDAHEAIRPVDVTLTPDMLKQELPPDQFNIYQIIWTRFVASQMAAAHFHDTTVIINCGNSQWRARGERILFDGYLKIMPKTDGDIELPPLSVNQPLQLDKLEKEQKFTQPPARFSEATLVKELEDLGIGRPSTYATIISTLLERDYVTTADKRLMPTDLGRVVCAQLMQHFSKLMDTGFTAEMESGLDKVAEGNEKWGELLAEFAADFNPTLAAAGKNMQSVKGGLPSGLLCPDCQKPLMIKFGKAGSFLACSDYPKCHYSSDFARDAQGQVTPVEKEKPQYDKVGVCPQCGKNLIIRKTHGGGRFIACSGYPDCHYAAPYSLGVPCPSCINGEIVEKTTKKGKVFYSCNQYPQCDFASWDKPIAERCPVCDNPYLVEKRTQGHIKIVCPARSCKYSREIDEVENEPEKN